jgi:hypothetical protein
MKVLPWPRMKTFRIFMTDQPRLGADASKEG